MDAPHRTEAACLLEQGALYRRRIGLEPVTAPGEPIFCGLKPGAFSLYFGDAPIYHFDLDGRWQRAFVSGTHYLKGLDATTQVIDRLREGPNLVLKRHTLDIAQANDFDARVRTTAWELLHDLGAGRLRRREPPAEKAQPLGNDELCQILERISEWDAAAWLAHRQRYRETYGQFPFLPPECQSAVVLQATLGHAGGRSFGLGPVTGHQVRTRTEFEQHAREVAALWGRRLLQSRVIFLAGSDLLHQPPHDIAADLHAIGRHFPIEAARAVAQGRPEPEEAAPRLDGIHVFLDDFRPPLPDRAAWREFASRGLIRVSLGVESGDPAVRAIYHKNWSDEELRSAVADLKAAGLGASLLTLVGAGGIEHAEKHLLETVRLIESLELGRGDFVFLLDENEIRDPSTPVEGMTWLRGSAWSEQQTQLKSALAPLKSRGIKVLPYTMEKQWA